MANTRRKNLRPKKTARKRTDHPAGCRISTEELAAISVDICSIAEASGHRPKLGAYVKEAILRHARLRRLELGLRKLVNDVENYFADPPADPEAAPGKEFFDSVKALLETP